MFNPNSQQPPQQKSLCPSHHLGFSDICFHENCSTRYLCRACKLDHTENHLRNIFSLAEVQNGDFLASIDDIITAKKETLLNKVKDKHVMLKKVNNAFFEIQNEIEKVLIETKTEIIHSIERLYQDLKGGYSEEYFQEIHEFLKKFSEEFKKQEITQLSSSLEQFSQIYFKTINSINSGIQIAAKYEDSSLNLQGILDSVKSSCEALLAKTTPETSKTVANKNKTHLTRASPQEIVCMEHLSNLGYFVTGGSYGLLTIWEDLNFTCVSQLQVHDGPIDNIVYLPHDLTLVTTSSDNHIAITKLNLEGNAESVVRNKTLKPIRHIVSIREQSKVAMISDQGHRMRVGDALKDLRDSRVLEIPRIADTSKLLLIPEDKLIGVTYLNNIALLSLEISTLQDNLQIEGMILSACYVPESKTIHALVQAGQDSRDDKYEEVIFRRNEQGRYSKFSQTQIERIKAFGKPLEIVADNSIILTVFSRAYSLRKGQNMNGEPKFYEIQSQLCSNENMRPAFISEASGKFILTKDIRKIEINSLP